MSTLTPKQVGDEMSMYTFRPGKPILKRLSGTTYTCFDKGHLRYTNSIPEGFVAVPEQVILEFFGTKYTLNIRKMERAFEDYAAGVTRRPTMRSLYLDTPTDFELFIRPLDSFYCSRLKLAFSGILNAIDNPRGRGGVVDWKARVNTLVSGTARVDRWNEAAGKMVYVRLQDFGNMDPVLDREIPPPYLKPYPAFVASTRATQTVVRGLQTDEEVREATDVDMLDRTNMGRSRKYRKALLLMSPWKNCIRTPNPFESKAYQRAFATAQRGFELRFDEFKGAIEARRALHRAEWTSYRAFKDDQRSINPSIPYVERPDVVEFETEWKDFIFGLRREMKQIEFQPVRSVLVPSAPTASVPSAPTASVPSAPTASVPSAPTASVPSAPPAPSPPAIKTVTVEHVKPLAKPPLIIPKIVMGQPPVNIVYEHHHSLDPDLRMIEQDIKYSKRIMVN